MARKQDKKVRNEEVKAQILHSGLEYSVLEGFNHSDLQDKRLAGLWKKTEKLLRTILGHLDIAEEYIGE